MRVLEPKLKLRVLGGGTGLPDREPIDNVELLRRHPDTSGKPEAFLKGFAAKIESGFGQGRRRMIREPGESPSLDEATSEDLAIEACRKALGRGHPAAFVLGSTTSPRYTGSQAAAVLGKLGESAPAFEIKAGCSTSQASLLYAYSLMQLGYPDVLVTCTETLSKTVHPDVKETWFGFADGAGALWLAKDTDDSPDESSSLRSASSSSCPSPSPLARFEVEKAAFHSDGEHVDLYTVPGRMPPLKEELEKGRYFISGDSAEMKTHALERYLRMVEAVLPTAADRDAIDWIVPHQVNLRLIEETTEKTGLSAVPVIWDSREHGNIGGASILFSLANAISEKKFEPGDRVLLISVGGGLNYGAQVLRFY